MVTVQVIFAGIVLIDGDKLCPQPLRVDVLGSFSCITGAGGWLIAEAIHSFKFSILDKTLSLSHSNEHVHDKCSCKIIQNSIQMFSLIPGVIIFPESSGQTSSPL